MEQDVLHESLLKAGEYHLDHYDDDSGRDHTLRQSTVISKLKSAVNDIKGYKKGEAETIRRVLNEIEMVSVKRMSEGFSELNFSLGVFNCFFIIYVFAKCPEHFLLIYLVEGSFMIPRKFYSMVRAKPLNQALYYLDFCWCMNFTAIFVIGLLVTSGLLINDDSIISDLAREACFNALLGVSIGTLMGANIVLPFVACLFHDVNTMTGLFVHMMPPMVAYTLLWHSEEIRSTWPEIFHLDYMDTLRYFPKSSGIFFPLGTGLDSVLGNSILLYFLWWIPYVCFMLLIGIELPKKLYPNGTPKNPTWDTVFHSTMRGGTCIAIGRTFRGRSKRDSLRQMQENDFDLTDFFIYMTFHMLLSLSSFYIIGYPCFGSQKFHLGMLVLVAWLTVARGASRYTYYTTQMYSRILRKQFAKVLDGSKEE